MAQNIDEWKAQLHDDDALVQIQALHKLNKAYNQVSLDTALSYGQEALDHSKQIAYDSLIGQSHAQLSLSFYYRRELDSLIHHAQAGKKIARKIKLDKLLAYCLKMEGIGHNYKGDTEKALACNQEGLLVYQALKDTLGMAGNYSNLARIKHRSAVYDEALAYFIKAEKLFEQINDLDGRGLSAAQIGDLYLDMEQYDKGIFYTQKALSLTDKEDPNLQIRYGDLLNTLGTIYHLDSTKLDSALLSFSESLALFEKIGDKEGMSIAHNNLGNIYRDQKKWNLSFFHGHKAISLSKAMGENRSLIHQYKDLGLSHELSGQLDSAEHYYLKSYAASDKLSDPFHLEKILERLYHYYKKVEQPTKALHFHELYVAHLEEKKGEAVQKEIVALEEQYKAEKRDSEIERLELQAAVQSSESKALWIGLLGLGLLSALIIFGMLYRRKNEQKLFALKQQMHEQERKELDQQLSYKTKQLTSHALHMVQKNKVLQELKLGINDLVKGSDATQKKALRSLIRRIDFNIQSDEDWNTFKLYFEQTNQNFYKNLSKINKDLTSTELKLCSLIKLNMNIKETASVLNIEPTSVKTARHRLRKKLNLVQGQDLTSFIRQVA